MTRYDEGRDAFRRHLEAPLLRAFGDPTTIPIDQARRIFLPPLPCDEIDRGMSRPTPAWWADWMRGYEDAQCEARDIQERGD